MRMCSCILLAGIFSPVMGDTRYSSGAGAGGRGLEAKRKQRCLSENTGRQLGLTGAISFVHHSFKSIRSAPLYLEVGKLSGHQR